jgi:hypothetical protein
LLTVGEAAATCHTSALAFAQFNDSGDTLLWIIHILNEKLLLANLFHPMGTLIPHSLIMEFSMHHDHTS